MASHKPALEAAQKAHQDAEAAEKSFHTQDIFNPKQPKRCGEDGCGESCGTCDLDQSCFERGCACIPQCVDRACGDNGCGGRCGTCADGERCSEQYQCVTILTDKTKIESECVGNCATGESTTREREVIVERAPDQPDLQARIQTSRVRGKVTSSAQLEDYIGSLNARLKTNQRYSADEAARLDQRIDEIDQQLPEAQEIQKTTRAARDEARKALNAVSTDAKKKQAAAISALQKARRTLAVKAANGALNRANSAVEKIEAQVEGADSRYAAKAARLDSIIQTLETLKRFRAEADQEVHTIDSGELSTFANKLRVDATAMVAAASQWSALDTALDPLASGLSFEGLVYPEGTKPYPVVAGVANAVKGFDATKKGIQSSIAAWQAAGDAVSALASALEQLTTAYPEQLKRQRLEIFDKAIAKAEASIVKLRTEVEAALLASQTQHTVLDQALASAKAALQAYSVTIAAAAETEGSALEALDMVMTATRLAMDLATADLTARQAAADAAKAKVAALKDERSEAINARNRAINLAERAASLEPQITLEINRLTAIVPGWKEAEAALAAAKTALEKAMETYAAQCEATIKEFAEPIAKAEATLIELTAPFASADETPRWGGSGVTCDADQAPLSQASYCLLSDYIEKVDKALKRRVDGWKTLSDDDKARYTTWPEEVRMLDNLSVSVHALHDASERLRGLLAQQRAFRAETADID